MFCQGIDPELHLENIDEIIEVYEKYNRLPINPRHPYAGEMAYVAFSGSHQDAIKKSMINSVQVRQINGLTHTLQSTLPTSAENMSLFLSTVSQVKAV